MQLLLLLLFFLYFASRKSEATAFVPDYTSAVAYPAVNFNSRNGQEISMIVMHYTAAWNDMGALRTLTQKTDGVSSHYLVFENGTVYQLVPESKRAWHAGAGAWREIRDVNSASIGIEIQNVGNLGNNNEPPFPQVQIDAVIDLSKSIIRRNSKILPGRVIGHEDMAPGRKPDPGHSFPWKKLYDAGIGVWVNPKPIVSGSSLSIGSSGAEVKRLQQQLSSLGYKLAVDGIFGPETRACVRAFQRHWRQEKYDGVADSSTIETLNGVLMVSQQLDSGVGM